MINPAARLMTANAHAARWRQEQVKNGGCARCARPAKRRSDGRTMSLCAEHLAYVAASAFAQRNGLPRPSCRQVITKAMLLHDLRCVARRLGARRVTMPLYEQHGSFSPKNILSRRIHQRWGEICVEAGLLPTFRGSRGIDEKACACGRTYIVYLGSEKCTRCYRCNAVARKRVCEPVSNWLMVGTGS